MECRISEARDDYVQHSVATGIGFLDHMLDQLHSHAQLRVHLRHAVLPTEGADPDAIPQYVAAIGTVVGTALNAFLRVASNNRRSSTSASNKYRSSTFACPLDEALVVCVFQRKTSRVQKGDTTNAGILQAYTLAPYGIYPRTTGRVKIGTLPTTTLESFWCHLAQAMPDVSLELYKIRGHNAHHIVESSFKSFSRALRNWIDGIDAASSDLDTSALRAMYGPDSDNFAQSLALQRAALIERSTKETSIRIALKLDGGAAGISIQTGVQTLDAFLSEFAAQARLSLHVTCNGDLWIDEHHTAEDVAISIGQALHEALGTKAGLNRMWYASLPVCNDINDDFKIAVTMDLSNRPCFVQNISALEEREMMGDLSCEMFEHVLDSIVTNARMTVHIVEEGRAGRVPFDEENDPYRLPVLMATARALGQALHMCALVDGRRAGKTASSKGTLSV
jgi:imidazoleglycerol-phosphate dehydratase